MSMPSPRGDGAASRPAPRDPKPITEPDDQGKLRVVVSFVHPRWGHPLSHWHDDWRQIMSKYDVQHLDVAISVIGAGGERSEMEGAGP
jgi:hypothetical protein